MSSTLPPVVKIKVTGPKTLIPELFLPEMDCDVNWTWRDFLSIKCQLDLDSLSKVVIRKATCYPVSSSFEAKLGDVVRLFIQKYARPRSSYTVRLVMKNNSPKRKRPVIRPDASAVRRTGRGVYRVPDSVDSASMTNNVGESSAGSSEEDDNGEEFVFQAPAAKRMKASSFESPSELNLPYPPIIDNLRPRFVDQDDIRSISTAMETRELEKQGIQMSVIKPVVLSRMKSMDNAELLRIQKELQCLVEGHVWHRLTYRVPRATHLLSNIFLIDTQ